jgi:hypothetical protein
MISGRLKPKYPDIDDMLRSAENLYMELATTNAWTGLRTKANQSGFVAKQEGNTKRFCWNCGQDAHMLKDCKKEKNQAAIIARKKAFNEAQAKARKEKKDGKKEEEKKETPKTGKWAPPQPSEKNKRVVNGKPMFWHFKTQRWIDDKKAGANMANSTQPPPAAPSGTPSGAPNANQPSNAEKAS